MLFNSLIITYEEVSTDSRLTDKTSNYKVISIAVHTIWYKHR